MHMTHRETHMDSDSIFELRDYTLHQGRREALIALFEERFIAPQNELGANVRAIFRDIDRPDQFVWLRSFANIEARNAALTGFYGGPVWTKYRDAANATMIDSDDVHLLRPVGPVLGAEARFDAALVVVEVYPVVPDVQFAMAVAGLTDLAAAFVSAAVQNDFPRLPVHADKVAVVLRLAPDFCPLSRIHGLPEPLYTLRLVPTTLSPLQIAGSGASPNDFDFLNGIWRIRNNRLRRRNLGSDDWDEFMADGRFWTLLDGVANVDEFDCPARGFKGMSLRALDLATGTWAIWWINSTMGTLLPPVRGGFSGRTGCFVGAGTDEGHPVLARFTWHRDPQAPRWEQAFSYDCGATWEVNWVMEFERA